jgi:hypothetical protein
MATRHKASGIVLVTLQQFSPEKNHYKHLNAVKRFSDNTYFYLGLPVMGEWNVSQGYDGEITHKGEWQHALDFDVVDDTGSTYREPGLQLKDYYCFDLPVIAPGNGHIVEILEGIEDNEINEVDLNNNWGNTIVIKHGEGFFSKLSHLKNGSVSVAVGDYVTKGHVIGMCGSTGRSPEPHLHFQLQTTPFIGSKTIPYPIAYYLSKTGDKVKFHQFDIPKEKEQVFNVQTTKLLTDAFHFVPGKTVIMKDGEQELKWEVFVDHLNRTYIYCHKTKSSAYFVNNGTVFYFTDFYGKTGSVLHHFYYGAQKVLLGYYKDIQVHDELMIDGFFNKLITGIHDFTAPFFHYCKVEYGFEFIRCDNEHSPEEIDFTTKCVATIGSKIYEKFNYSFQLKEGKIHSFTINNTKTILCN